MLLLFLTIFLTQGGSIRALQDKKIWLVDKNFMNPRNWKNEHVPCAKDRIIFPSDAKVVIYLPSVISFREMVLPLEGEFIMEEGMNFLFNNDKQESSCTGQGAYFVVSTDSWYDPENWNISSSNTYPKNIAQKNVAVPHAFHIPCPTDYVVFPKKSSFQVHLDSVPVSISGVEINGIKYDKSEFEGMLSSHIGRLLFPNSPQITVTGETCTDSSGCACYNDDPQVLPNICAKVHCPPLVCSDPVKPVGHCCPVCGAYLEMNFNDGFDLNKLVSFLESYLSKAEFQYVESFTSKTYLKLIQSVFVDGTKDWGAASEVSQIIHDALIQDMKTANLNKLKSVKLYKSEQWNAGVPTHSSYTKHGISSGGVVAIIFIITALIGAGVAWYIYKKRHIPGFSFARFDLRSNKVELELGTTPHEELDPEDSSYAEVPAAVSKAFDNPVYDTVEDTKEEPVQKPSNEENVVENPMFMVFEQSKDASSS